MMIDTLDSYYQGTPMSEFTNTRLGGRYEIRERIGAGGMARVFKAWDVTLERIVAVKILYEHLAEDATFKQRFEQEAKFVASFNHPNIVQIYDFNSFERDGMPVYYMVMAYIPGKTLKGVLEEYCEQGERLSRERIFQIMLNLTDALGYAHSRGMVHRDIKPGNILFDERQQAILTDFGIAKLAQGSGLTRDSVTVGTPAYMSPEQAVGGQVDLRSDLYALGVMFYEMLTGKVPYPDDGSLSVLFRHLNDPIPQVSQLLPMGDPTFDPIILKALAKDPEQRYQSAQEFADDIAAAFTGKPIAPPRSAETSNFASIAFSSDSGANTSQSRMSIAIKNITRYIPPTTRRYAPMGVFIVGMMLIGVLVGAGLVNNQLQAQRANQPTADAQVESMTEGGVASMTDSGPLEFTSTFSQGDSYNSLWAMGEMTGVMREITPEGFYRFSNGNAGTALTTILEGNYVYDYVIITMEAALDPSSAPNSGYGIVFRYQDPDNYNVFAVDGAGRYSIWVRSAGEWHELRNARENWTANEAIEPVGNINRLVVHVQGSLLTGEVNGVRVTSVVDTTLSAGRIGIYLAAPPNTDSTVALVDSYEAVPSVADMTEP
jgi:serine/threonine protein kinase